MLMYNLFEHSLNYSHKRSSVWFYSKCEAANFNADIVIKTDFKSFKCN